jgi:hypothetical protein
MRPAEIEVKISIAQKEADHWRNVLTKKSCKDCEHYSMPECMKHNAKPPPDVVATGCDDWIYDCIPF